ncbi:MAG: PqqD family protein [Opitutaceae bacterium]|nr:PqqD family protein [Opitutaceae bacterium]MBP9912280.1 PqqD family protein [Opitutaceae bacterium]
MSSPLMNAYFRVNEPDVTYESFDSEVLAINLRNGNYYSLRESAVPIWLLAVRGTGSAEISRLIARHCQADEAAIASAVRGLLQELETEALLVRLEAKPATLARPSTVPLPSAFVPPAFDRYTDMQQLLLMDPIHEVDASGWPSKAPPSDQG